MAAAPVVRRSLSHRAAEGLSRDDRPLQPHLDIAGEAAAAALAHVARRGPGARLGLRPRRDDADTVDARGWECRCRPGGRNHRAPVRRAAFGGVAPRRHRDAGPSADAGGCGLCSRESSVGARADRLGRLLPDTARSDRAARALRRLRDPLAGRAVAPAADWRAEDRRSAQQRRRPVVESSEREGVSRAGECFGQRRCADRRQPGAATDEPRRPARTAVSPRRHEPLHPQELSRRADGGAQLVVRLSVRVQLLRGGGDVEPAVARAVAGAARTGHAASRHDLCGRRGPDARHGLLHPGGEDRRVRGPHHRPRPALVGARPGRHADAVPGRDVGGHGALGAEDDFLRRRIRAPTRRSSR